MTQKVVSNRNYVCTSKSEEGYQLLKYRYLSSREIRMSVMRGGRVGSAQPIILGHSCLMTTLCTH